MGIIFICDSCGRRNGLSRSCCLLALSYSIPLEFRGRYLIQSCGTTTPLVRCWCKQNTYLRRVNNHRMQIGRCFKLAMTKFTVLRRQSYFTATIMCIPDDSSRIRLQVIYSRYPSHASIWTRAHQSYCLKQIKSARTRVLKSISLNPSISRNICWFLCQALRGLWDPIRITVNQALPGEQRCTDWTNSVRGVEPCKRFGNRYVVSSTRRGCIRRDRGREM